MSSQFDHNIYFTTYTIQNWKPLLRIHKRKQIIFESFGFLIKNKRINIFAFVIMDNHFHILWQIEEAHRLKIIVKDFKSFTSKELLETMSHQELQVYKSFENERMHQVWNKESLSVLIYSSKFLHQKMNFIHDSPRRAGYITDNYNYPYSRYQCYTEQETEFEFLTLI